MPVWMSARAALTTVLSRKVTNSTSDRTARASRGRSVPPSGGPLTAGALLGGDEGLGLVAPGRGEGGPGQRGEPGVVDLAGWAAADRRHHDDHPGRLVGSQVAAHEAAQLVPVDRPAPGGLHDGR